MGRIWVLSERPLVMDARISHLMDMSLLRKHHGLPKHHGVEIPEPEISGIIGKNAVMKPVYKLIIKYGTSDAAVLITGASGTGKELIARYSSRLHRASIAAARIANRVNRP